MREDKPRSDNQADSENLDAQNEKFSIEFGQDFYKMKDFAKKKPPKKKGLSIFVKIMMILIIVGISVLLSIIILFAASDVLGVNKSDHEVVIEIPQKSSVADIAQILEDKGVIKSKLLFQAYNKLAKTGEGYQFGTYALNSNMSYDSIMLELKKYSKSKETIRVTFPEGFSLIKMANRLEENKVCTAEEFLKAINSTDFGYDWEKDISDDSLKYYKMEGFAFPDTYEFYINDNPTSVAKKLLENFDAKITDKLQARMKKLHMTLEETLIIASIVQSEAGKTDEMKNVASVYRNRLKDPGTYPNLQADPTRGYARELKKQMNIVNQDILDAYDTYQGKGLPPGAICNPGIEAIKATLYPAKTKYYYFCTNLDTGEFFYATNLKDHEANLVKAGLV